MITYTEKNTAAVSCPARLRNNNESTGRCNAAAIINKTISKIWGDIEQKYTRNHFSRLSLPHAPNKTVA